MIVLWMKIKNFILKLLHSIFCNNKTESMKLQFYKNIDVVQINIKAGVSEYFFPTNVDWADQKIDKMIVYGSNPDTGELSPIDGITPILDREQVGSAYFDLYDKSNSQIGYSISAIDILHTNNHPLEINNKISLQTSKLVFTKTPEDDGCMLIYVFWGTKIVDEDVPNHNVTFQFTLSPCQEKKLSDIIDTYIHAQSRKLKGIYVWGGYGYWNFLYITLRDYNYKTVVKLLPAGMCRPPMGVDPIKIGDAIAEQAQSVQVDPMYLDSADIDFDNSFVYYSSPEGSVDANITITLLY